MNSRAVERQPLASEFASLITVNLDPNSRLRDTLIEGIVKDGDPSAVQSIVTMLAGEREYSRLASMLRTPRAPLMRALAALPESARNRIAEQCLASDDRSAGAYRLLSTVPPEQRNAQCFEALERRLRARGDPLMIRQELAAGDLEAAAQLVVTNLSSSRMHPLHDPQKFARLIRSHVPDVGARGQFLATVLKRLPSSPGQSQHKFDGLPELFMELDQPRLLFEVHEHWCKYDPLPCVTFLMSSTVLWTDPEKAVMRNKLEPRISWSAITGTDEERREHTLAGLARLNFPIPQFAFNGSYASDLLNLKAVCAHIRRHFPEWCLQPETLHGIFERGLAFGKMDSMILNILDTAEEFLIYPSPAQLRRISERLVERVLLGDPYADERREFAGTAVKVFEWIGSTTVLTPDDQMLLQEMKRIRDCDINPLNGSAQL